MNQQFVFEAEPFEIYTEFETEVEGEVISRDLPVKFRNNYNDFRLEVARRIGRWTIFRTDQGRRALKLATDNDKILRDIHKDLKNLGTTEGKSVPIFAKFIYEGEGASRRVKAVMIDGFFSDIDGAYHIYGTAP